MNVNIADDQSTETFTTIGEVLRALNVSDYITSIESKQPKKQNSRQELLNQLYQIYLTACNKDYYWKNKKRYNAYLRKYHPEVLRTDVTKEEYYRYKEAFKKAKLPLEKKYLAPIDSADGAWWMRFSHLKGDDGIECLSIMVKDATEMVAFNKNPIPYILGASGKLSIDKLA